MEKPFWKNLLPWRRKEYKSSEEILEYLRNKYQGPVQAQFIQAQWITAQLGFGGSRLLESGTPHGYGLIPMPNGTVQLIPELTAEYIFSLNQSATTLGAYILQQSRTHVHVASLDAGVSSIGLNPQNKEKLTITQQTIRSTSQLLHQPFVPATMVQNFDTGCSNADLLGVDTRDTSLLQKATEYLSL